MAFSDIAKAAAQDFLLTAIVVDDQAMYDDPPVEAVTKDDVVEPEPGQVQVRGLATAAKRGQGNTLHAKEVADGFAAAGLFCSVIKPRTKAEVVQSSTLNLARRADLIVLDWSFDADNGATTLEFLKLLIDSEVKADRYRVVAIYTGEKDLAGIGRSIKEALEAHCAGFAESDGPTFRRNHTLVTVYAKPETDVTQGFEQRVVSESNLGSKLVMDFAAITNGLLSVAALRSLGAIRRHTHKILARFSTELDAPFLTHRMLTSPPADVEQQVAPLIVEEIDSVLEQENVGSSVNSSTVNDYLDELMPNLSLDDISKDSAKAKAFLLEALTNGLETTAKSNSNRDEPGATNFKSMNPNKMSKMTCILSGKAADSDALDEELAELMAVRTRYTSDPPNLGPGVVVRIGEAPSAEYWLCVQPACDCVRIEGNRQFLFLKMVEGPNFGYVLRSAGDGQAIRLRVSERIHEAKLMEFAPTNGRVRGTANGEHFEFTLVGAPGAVARYICTMKLEHGLRAASLLSGNIGRIGLTESEWARRHLRGS